MLWIFAILCGRGTPSLTNGGPHCPRSAPYNVSPGVYLPGGCSLTRGPAAALTDERLFSITPAHNMSALLDCVRLPQRGSKGEEENDPSRSSVLGDDKITSGTSTVEICEISSPPFAQRREIRTRNMNRLQIMTTSAVRVKNEWN